MAAFVESVKKLRPDAHVSVCRHSAGPPACWCRPPLPGLLAKFAVEHGIDFSKSTVVGKGAAHRTLAETFGARFEER
jgi:histidinol phosphatase-like enzyme